MIIQLGAILGGLGAGIIQAGVQTLFRPAAARGLTNAEFAEIRAAEQRLSALGEAALTSTDPFTGGTILFRSSQQRIPGLIENLALDAALRAESERFVQSPEFLEESRRVLAAREAGFIPVQQDFERTEVVRQGVAKEPIGPMMVPNRVTKRPEGREVVQQPAVTLAGPCAGATTAASRAACAAGGFV